MKGGETGTSSGLAFTLALRSGSGRTCESQWESYIRVIRPGRWKGANIHKHDENQEPSTGHAGHDAQLEHAKQPDEHHHGHDHGHHGHAGHGAHGAHGAHADHAGHSPEALGNKLWVSLLLTLPIHYF